MADEEGERRPLLADSAQNDSPPPEYSQSTIGQGGALEPFPPQQHVTVPPIGPDELPPPYSEVPPGVTPTINCKVCQAIVSIEGKQNQHVVKCQHCNEATPIKAAPPGKKYVRCPCNCLLICRATAQKIACPRENCKRIINLGGAGHMPTVTVRAPNSNHMQCAYCAQTFLYSLQQRPLAKCPHCNRVSAVIEGYARRRMIICLLIAFIFLGAGTGVTVGTYEMARNSGGIYTLWIGAFIVGFISLIRAAYFGSVRTSQVIGPA